MKAERLKQIEEIYHAALEISPSKRESFFNKFCGEDEELRREIESLLSFEKSSDNFFDTPPESFVAEMFSEKNDSTNLIGKAVNQYKILSLLGKGGMGAVYLALDTRLDRQVALKILPPDFIDDKGRMERFVREAKTASALNHPNIITIYEIGALQDTHYIATELIEGETLTKHFKTTSLNLKNALDIFIQMASALDAAHRAGIIHRDIKPDNVMIRPDGLLKILDFGIAKLSEPSAVGDSDKSEATTVIQTGTSPGMIVGTANYMSPEQARGKTVDARSDIFSFGIVLYEVLTGKKPFKGETAMDTIAALLHLEPSPLNQLLPDLPPAIEQIVNKTLRKNTDKRYQNAKDLLTDLRSVKQRLDYEEIERNITPVTSEADSEKTETEFYDSSASGQTISENAPPNNFLSQIGRKGVLLTALVFVLLVAGGFFGYRYLTASKPIESIAVMPFANETGNANNEYLSDGLTDVLINKFSQLPNMKIIARSSAFKYKGKEIDVGEIAKTLGVQAVVTGRITQQGDNLQISVEMINTLDNTRIWGEMYDRKVSAALNVPEEIAQAVSEKLQLKLSGEQERQMAKQITDNPQAFQHYLNGVSYRRKNGAENIRTAIDYQNQALTLDPNFARAYTELSINYSNLVEIGVLSPKEGMPLARAAVEKALALDETLAEVHYTLARVRQYDFDSTGAENAFKRAIELNPNLAAAHTVYAEYLSRSGRFDEGNASTISYGTAFLSF